MTTTEITFEPKPKTFGILGVVAGFLGLLAVLVGPAIRDAIIPPPPAEQQLAETIVTLKQHITAKLKKTPPPPKPGFFRRFNGWLRIRSSPKCVDERIAQ